MNWKKLDYPHRLEAIKGFFLIIWLDKPYMSLWDGNHRCIRTFQLCNSSLITGKIESWEMKFISHYCLINLPNEMTEIISEFSYQHGIQCKEDCYCRNYDKLIGEVPLGAGIDLITGKPYEQDYDYEEEKNV